MDLQTLRDTPSWNWPKNATQTLVGVLQNPKSKEADRLLAAELAGDIVAIDDELAGVLLSILRNNADSEELRSQAALSLGPILELADTDGFDDPDGVPITEQTFDRIRASLREMHQDTRLPKDVRRRILEASVRAPEEWHADAIRAAYGSKDEDWRLTAVHCMQSIRGFESQILEALQSKNPDVHCEAVYAAGAWGIKKAWEHISELVKSEDTDKRLLLAAIEAIASIRPQEAESLLVDLTESRDEDIVGAAEEALAMSEGIADCQVDEEGEDDLDR